MATNELRSPLQIVRNPENGVPHVVEPTGVARYEIPAALVERVTAAVGAVPTLDEETERFFEERHLLESERVLAVEAWAAAREGPALPLADPDELDVSILEGSRFSCHGCGLCCRVYGVVPATDEEHAAIVARAAELAPHVATPQAAWFSERRSPADPTLHRWHLSHQPNGRCVFLGEQNLCLVHKHLGIEAKPLTCRLFPLQFTRRPDTTIVTIRLECDTLARSRDDGVPLGEQLEWVREMARRLDPPAVGPIVHVGGGAYIPFVLARKIEVEALSLMSGAPSVEHGILAIRDLSIGLGRLLGTPLLPADLDRAEAWILAPIPERRAELGPVSPPHALESLRHLLTLLLDRLPKFFARRAPELTDDSAQKTDDRFTSDVFRTLYASLGARLRWPAHGEAGATAAEEGARAAAVDPAVADPAVLDFVRECLVQLVASSRAFQAQGGLVLGFAQMALTYLFARWGVRLLAARRGAARATREDWNRALSVIERSMRPFNLERAAPLVFGLFADLFWTQDAPA